MMLFVYIFLCQTLPFLFMKKTTGFNVYLFSPKHVLTGIDMTIHFDLILAT
ncbi:hypothetical protein HanPSC8_Chr05g0216531 [Helianthus annuus]|nr:hypothetical protein HanPSC8_Chr05g0216531 [Helianthus annuus]